MKLSKGQVSVLRYCRDHEAVLIRHTWNYPDFWEQLPGASPSTFYSLVNRGLLRCENRHFHYITQEGMKALIELDSALCPAKPRA